VEGRITAPIWLVLFALSQSTDAVTTAIDRSRGAIEAMPASAWLLASGGPVRFWTLKLLLVVAIGAALLLATRWLRRDVPGAARLYRLVLLATQIGTVIAAVVSLQNALLASTL
jgi:hypothetical protein